MTDRELRRLSRRDLLELLVQQEQQNELLNEKIAALEKTVKDRSIAVENAGSMAEAALVLNGIFENADKAAAQYLENIKRCSLRQERLCENAVSEAEIKAKAIIEEAENEKNRKIAEADERWDRLKTKLEKLYLEHPGLKEFIAERSDAVMNISDEKQ